jgi:ABC-type transport system involved in Fe-S cluster assembly fused permease/ATPase subunit
VSAIAHRLSAIARTDWRVVLARDRTMETGTHAALQA